MEYVRAFILDIRQVPQESPPNATCYQFEHAGAVDKYTQHELTKGRLIGPLPNGVSTLHIHCSPFGVIPKRVKTRGDSL